MGDQVSISSIVHVDSVFSFCILLHQNCSCLVLCILHAWQHVDYEHRLSSFYWYISGAAGSHFFHSCCILSTLAQHICRTALFTRLLPLMLATSKVVLSLSLYRFILLISLVMMVDMEANCKYQRTSCCLGLRTVFFSSRIRHARQGFAGMPACKHQRPQDRRAATRRPTCVGCLDMP